MIASTNLAALETLAASVTASGVIIGILGFIGAFGLAVFVHELGHFLAAKAFKVPVERFVIGMDKEAMGFLPRCIWEQKIGETVYGLSLVPLGGYVKMSGVVHPDIERYLEGDKEELPPAPDGPRRDTRKAEATPSLQEQAMGDMAALYKKPFWQKFIIYSAGVIMNLILAMIIVAIMFSVGSYENAPFPARVAWSSPDEEGFIPELNVGDSVIRINDLTIEDGGDLDKFAEQEIDEHAEELDEGKYAWKESAPAYTVTLQSGEGEQYQYSFTPETPRDFVVMVHGKLQQRPAYVDMIVPNSPSDKGGMKRGDVIVSINGESIADWAQMTHIIRQSPGQELEVNVDRKGESIILKVTPWESTDEAGVGQIGILGGNDNKELIKESPFVAMAKAPERIYLQVTGYWGGLKKIGGKVATGNVKAASRELSGPVGIFQFAYRMTQYGVIDWMKFMIILNVALAVMNILPIPILDGGHIMFALYEAIFRKPVPPQILVPILNGAVIFILIFFVLVTFNDFWKIFS